ncbi:MAG: stage 0 sporulation protein [Bacilli bacterium]|nr:stage 0 sporulation protein [Bacilli bacterium]
MKEVIGVTFDESKIYYFDPAGHKIKEGATVIVETEQGMQFGTVKIPLTEMPETKIKGKLKQVLRIATKRDYNQYQKNKKEAITARNKCQKIADKQELNMKIIDASYTFDRDKLIFRFLADNRVDFRDLAKELAKIYKVRIELRQIGVRDKAKEVGGYGPCGRKLCCASYLKDLDTVSINMAKNQNIALNPTKINGACGRLMCCLKYEDDCYTECRKKMKKIGDKIKTEKGEGIIQGLDILKQKYKVEVPDYGIIEVDKK